MQNALTACGSLCGAACKDILTCEAFQLLKKNWKALTLFISNLFEAFGFVAAVRSLAAQFTANGRAFVKSDEN